MQNFIIFFRQKEGTSPLVRLLNNFDRISVVHQVNERGWEPFDAHNCGPMPPRELETCLHTIFNGGPIDMDMLNANYTKTSAGALEAIDSSASAVGFKMRFRDPGNPFYVSGFDAWNRLSGKLYRECTAAAFKKRMFGLLRKANVTVFIAVRQDLLRWGLSMYHGDGTGRPGHLQFKLAGGEVKKKEIGRFQVDCSRLRRIISRLEKAHAEKRALMKDLKSAGITTYPLRYEDFLADKPEYFKYFFECLSLEATDNEIDCALQRGTQLKKVHSNEISDIVANHQEVTQTFGDCFAPWP